MSSGEAMIVTSPDQPPVVRPATDPEIQQHTDDTVPVPTEKKVTMTTETMTVEAARSLPERREMKAAAEPVVAVMVVIKETAPVVMPPVLMRN